MQSVHVYSGMNLVICHVWGWGWQVSFSTFLEDSLTTSITVVIKLTVHPQKKSSLIPFIEI